MNLKGLVEGLLSELQKVSESDAVVGAPRDAGKATVVPLSRISIGFGSGTGQLGGRSQGGESEGGGNAEAGGVGGAIVVEPRAFVIVGEDGHPYMMALKKGKAAVIRRGVAIGPDAEAALLVAQARGELTANGASSGES
ncbi:MAG: spore germination protein GerW family protein [Polyangiaceae bacterium]|nr:spore germination protein GerW family protein [Polyangiaceae bacterium]